MRTTRRTAKADAEQDAEDVDREPRVSKRHTDADNLGYETSDDEAVAVPSRITRAATKPTAKPKVYLEIDSDIETEISHEQAHQDEEQRSLTKSTRPTRAAKKPVDGRTKHAAERSDSAEVGRSKRKAADVDSTASRTGLTLKARKTANSDVQQPSVHAGGKLPRPLPRASPLLDLKDPKELDDEIGLPPRLPRESRGATLNPSAYAEVESDFDDEEGFALRKQTQTQLVRQDVDEDDDEAKQDAQAPIVKTQAHHDITTTESEVARPLKRKAAGVSSSATPTGAKRKARETSTNKTQDPSSLPGDADSLQPHNHVDQEITRLKGAIPDWKQLFVAKAPGKAKTQKLPSPLCSLIGKYYEKDGRLWRGGLIHWLRSGSVLPIIKLWIDAVKEDENMFALLKKFLPLKEYPWKAQLEQVTELAKLPDAGTSKNAPGVVLLCAVYTRKLFLCNHARLLQNGSSSAEFIWHRILDVACAVLFTAFHDLVAPKSHETFFGTLLESPLVLRMHSDVRKTVEKKYPLPEAAYHPTDATSFFAAGSKQDDFMPPPPPPGAIDHHAYYAHDPFSEKEQLLFWLAYQDETKTSSLFGIDYKHIPEFLPGRCEQEIAAFFKLNKVSLGLESERRVVIARGGEEMVQAEDVADADVAPALTQDDVAEQHTDAEMEGELEGDDAETISIPSRRLPPLKVTQADALALLSIGISVENTQSSAFNEIEIAESGREQPSDTSEDDTYSTKAAATAPIQTRGFESLQAYVPPPRPTSQPPLSRTNIHPEVLMLLLILDQALGDRNEANLALAEKQVDLEDARTEGGADKVDSLKVQLAWYERDEAKALLVEKQRVLNKVQRELVLVRAKYGRDTAKKDLVCEKEVVDLENDKSADEHEATELPKDKGQDEQLGMVQGSAVAVEIVSNAEKTGGRRFPKTPHPSDDNGEPGTQQ